MADYLDEDYIKRTSNRTLEKADALVPPQEDTYHSPLPNLSKIINKTKS
jgi:hypothetical protein